MIGCPLVREDSECGFCTGAVELLTDVVGIRAEWIDARYDAVVSLSCDHTLLAHAAPISDMSE